MKGHIFCDMHMNIKCKPKNTKTCTMHHFHASSFISVEIIKILVKSILSSSKNTKHRSLTVDKPGQIERGDVAGKNAHRAGDDKVLTPAQYWHKGGNGAPEDRYQRNVEGLLEGDDRVGQQVTQV